MRPHPKEEKETTWETAAILENFNTLVLTEKVSKGKLLDHKVPSSPAPNFFLTQYCIIELPCSFILCFNPVVVLKEMK